VTGCPDDVTVYVTLAVRVDPRQWADIEGITRAKDIPESILEWIDGQIGASHTAIRSLAAQSVSTNHSLGFDLGS
jgi:hypothetical protein